MPIWAPDGTRIAFASARSSNPPNVFTRVVSGNSEDERRSTSPLMNFPTSWSADGSLIVYESIDPKTKFDLWLLRLENNAQERLPLNTPFNESGGTLSPDGRWIAYVSDQSGRNEVWVASFPSGQTRRPVSVEGGEAPKWRGANPHHSQLDHALGTPVNATRVKLRYRSRRIPMVIAVG